jgi:hypothetical protein
MLLALDCMLVFARRMMSAMIRNHTLMVLEQTIERMAWKWRMVLECRMVFALIMAYSATYMC